METTETDARENNAPENEARENEAREEATIDRSGLIVPPAPSLRQSIKDRAYLYRGRLDLALGRVDAIARSLARQIQWHDYKPGRPTVLCFSRATFNKDVAELRLRTDLNYASLRTTIVKRAQEAWMPPEWRVQTYFTRCLDHELAAHRDILVAFGKALLKHAAAIHPVDAMLAANSDYWQDESVRRAGRELGIPFLTLCRENYTIAHDQGTVENRYGAARFKYTGTAIAVYSQATKDVMEQLGSFPAGSIWVTGAPRYDRWRDIPHLADEQRDCVTLISYAWPIYAALDNFREAGAIFANLAKANPKLKFVLKVKKEKEDKEAFDLCPELNSPRVETSGTWPLFDLFPRSRAVIGCNSLAVAEALLSNSPVIVPAWRGALAEPRTCLFHFSNPLHSKCMYFPRSAEEFTDLLTRAINNDLPVLGTLSERRACFTEHILIPDEASSSELVERYIRHYLPARSA
jgi:hypothetical protein